MSWYVPSIRCAERSGRGAVHGSGLYSPEWTSPPRAPPVRLAAGAAVICRAARWAPAGHRAGGESGAGADTGRDRCPPGRPAPLPGAGDGCPAPPAHAARDGGLELRAPPRRGPAPLRPTRCVRILDDARRSRGRGRGHRPRCPGRAHDARRPLVPGSRGQRWIVAVPDVGDTAVVRAGTTAGVGRGGPRPTCPRRLLPPSGQATPAGICTGRTNELGAPSWRRDDANIQAALRWADAHEPALAFRLAAALWPYWDAKWSERHAVPYLAGLLSRSDLDVPADDRAWGLVVAAELAANPGDARRADSVGHGGGRSVQGAGRQSAGWRTPCWP